MKDLISFVTTPGSAMSSDNSDKKVIRMVNSLHDSPESRGNAIETTGYENAICQFCFGTGTRLKRDEGGGIIGAVICECRRSNSKAKFLVAARIPPRYEHCTFESYKDPKGMGSLSWAKQVAKNVVKDYPAVERGLLLVGSVGVGKTHLAVAMLKGLMEKGVPSLFCEFGSLLKQIQDSYNSVSRNSELRVLAPVYETEVLVLDELGSTVLSDWVRETMYQIINRRYNDKKFTIFTTNYFDYPKVEPESESPMNNRTFSKKDSAERIRAMTTLEDRIGTRLRSRLYEMCDTLTIEGDDFRPARGLK